VKSFSKVLFPALVVGSGALALVPSANAAAIDVAAVVTDIGAQAGPVGLIGGAVLLLMIGIKAYKWVRKAA
jgi:hypothetical protein